jgi:hypothetical protein
MEKAQNPISMDDALATTIKKSPGYGYETDIYESIRVEYAHMGGKVLIRVLV